MIKVMSAKKMIPPRSRSAGRCPFGLRNDSDAVIL